VHWREPAGSQRTLWHTHRLEPRSDVNSLNGSQKDSLLMKLRAWCGAVLKTLGAQPIFFITQSSALPASAGTTHKAEAKSPQYAMGPQFSTTHVYVTPGTLDSFVASWIATFGGTTSSRHRRTVTPTPSETISQLVFSPVGTLSVFDFQTPIPYPFGAERTGFLVRDFDQGVQAARDSGAQIVVAPFPDPVGLDAVVQFPGGINTQLYWHPSAPDYPALSTVPENRLYLSSDSADAFIDSYLKFTGGRVVRDDMNADAAEIGIPGQHFRRIHIASSFGDALVLVTEGHLPYPFGREVTGYAVNDLKATLDKATVAGARVLSSPVTTPSRTTAAVQFPGGYIAEIHSAR
jgi:hypothetical protein